MKQKKLSLENLKVQSFVTSLNDNERSGLKGGDGGASDDTCYLTQCYPQYCPDTMQGGVCSIRICFVSDFTCDPPCPNPTIESACC
jgi:hypothetical protein